LETGVPGYQNNMSGKRNIMDMFSEYVHDVDTFGRTRKPASPDKLIWANLEDIGYGG